MSTGVQQRSTRLGLKRKKRKKLAIAISPNDGELVQIACLWCTPNKFFFELYLPNIEINLATVKDHSISCRPNDPACSNEDVSEKWAAKGCSSFNNHV
jgi:hypothetical protein